VASLDSHERPIYGIGAVARMLEISATTIRNWEERYGGLQPARSDGGQRLYSREDLERLRFLRDEVAAGASPADAHRLLAERAAAGSGLTVLPDADAPRLLILVAERDQYAAELVEYFLISCARRGMPLSLRRLHRKPSRPSGASAPIS
jgi:DNA-binding transcriptional MerR regulator